ncbi:MAG: Gfo/Idh/MocA family oxidoreductase [Deinococcota bacterium]
MSNPLSFAVVGAGANIYNNHKQAIRALGGNLVALCDVNADVGKARADEVGAAFYTSVEAMLAEMTPDVVSVVTPHPFHANIAIQALEAGCNVLVEKPMAVHVAEADAMIAAAETSGKKLALSFQQRLRPQVRALKQAVDDGAFGRIQHIDMATAWPRTNVYYQGSSWRATWQGEGGGVLLNQAPHQLDQICHLLGMPSKVTAWARRNLFDIETEDTIQAMLEWPSGTLGSVHISTAEGWRPERVELVGSKRYANLEGTTFTVKQLASDFTEFVTTADAPFARPDISDDDFDLPQGVEGHTGIYENLHAAITEGAPLVADGAEGRMSLELANAMLYSSLTGETIDLPLNRTAYKAMLDELIAGTRQL